MAWTAGNRSSDINSFQIPDRRVAASVPASLLLMATASSALGEVSDARGLAIPETTEQRLWVQRLPTQPSVATRDR
jgi:hypothetical protein